MLRLAPSIAGSTLSTAPGSSWNLTILTPFSLRAHVPGDGDSADSPPKEPHRTTASQPSPRTTGTSSLHTVATEFSPFFLSRGMLIMIWVMSLGFLASCSTRGYISQWLYLDEAITHWASPNPNLPWAPLWSKWST